MKKRLPLLILVIAAVAGFVYWKIQSNPSTYAGTVEATEVDVSAKVASTIKTIDVREGQPVTADQTLATLTGEDYKLAQTQADDDYRRGRQLYLSGSLPQEQFDHIKSQKELTDLRVQWCTITSPITGTVLTQYHEPGEFVNPGMKLFTLADLREVWCQVYIPQPMLVKISYGQKLTATLPELKDRTFTGTVSHINSEAEFTPKNVQTRKERVRLVYAVKVTFPNPDGLLKPGMTLEIHLPE